MFWDIIYIRFLIREILDFYEFHSFSQFTEYPYMLGMIAHRISIQSPKIHIIKVRLLALIYFGGFVILSDIKFSERLMLYYLVKEINWDEALKYFAVQKIQRIFNVPPAPWGKSGVDYEQLMMILSNCESIDYSRSLTYLTENDDLISLTLSHIPQKLKGLKNLTLTKLRHDILWKDIVIYEQPMKI